MTTDTSADVSFCPQGLRRASGGNLTLQRRIIASGEGSIYLTDDPLSLAKVYHSPTFEKAQKLQHMLENPPEDPTVSQGHISIAWPKDLILDKHGVVHGFLMPKIRGGVTLPSVYNPRLRRKKHPGFNWYYLHTTALNLAWILEALHAKGYIVGDLKPENFLVNDRALVSILDTDSFQIPGKSDQDPFLCPVGSEGFTPPELFGKDLTKEPRLPVHDHFGLAVLIYQLLFGIHPFAGVWKGSEPPPSLKDCIKKGLVPFSSNRTASKFVEKSPLIPSLESLPKILQDMFSEAFVEGHWDPTKRPSAQKWHKVLEKSLKELQVCDISINHFLYPSQGICPWCQLTQVSGVDVFPFLIQGEKPSPFTSLKLFEKALSEGQLEKAETFLKPLEGMSEGQTPAFQKAFLLLSQVKKEQEFIYSFAAFLETHPTEAKILEYFNKRSFLEGSSVYTLKSPLLQDRSLQDIKDHAKLQIEVLERLEALQEKASYQKVPLSFLFEELLTLIPEKDISQYPVFAPLSKDLKEAQNFFERYRLLKQHVLEEREEGLFLWHPCFEYPLQRDGLWIPFLNLIRSHAESLASTSRFSLEKTKIFEEGTGIWVRLIMAPSSHRKVSPVQSLLKEGCVIFIHQTESPSLDLDQHKTSFYFPISPQNIQTGQVDFFIDTSFMSGRASTCSIASVWFLEQTPLVQGSFIPIEKEKRPAPLYTKISRPSSLKVLVYKALYTLFPSYFSDKINVTVSLWTKETLELPPFVLKVGRHRVALDLDLSSQSKIVGYIPATLLKRKVKHKENIEIPLEAFWMRSFRKGVWSIEKDPASSLETSSFFFASL